MLHEKARRSCCAYIMITNSSYAWARTFHTNVGIFWWITVIISIISSAFSLWLRSWWVRVEAFGTRIHGITEAIESGYVTHASDNIIIQRITIKISIITYSVLRIWWNCCHWGIYVSAGYTLIWTNPIARSSGWMTGISFSGYVIRCKSIWSSRATFRHDGILQIITGLSCVTFSRIIGKMTLITTWMTCKTRNCINIAVHIVRVAFTCSGSRHWGIGYTAKAICLRWSTTRFSVSVTGDFISCIGCGIGYIPRWSSFLAALTGGPLEIIPILTCVTTTVVIRHRSLIASRMTCETRDCVNIAVHPIRVAFTCSTSIHWGIGHTASAVICTCASTGYAVSVSGDCISCPGCVILYISSLSSLLTSLVGRSLEIPTRLSCETCTEVIRQTTLIASCMTCKTRDFISIAVHIVRVAFAWSVSRHWCISYSASAICLRWSTTCFSVSVTGDFISCPGCVILYISSLSSLLTSLVGCSLEIPTRLSCVTFTKVIR